MKLSEDFDNDRERQIDFLTDDEDNEAERSLIHDSHSSDSELVVTPCRNCSQFDAPMGSNSLLWPQSYRESMNMYAITASHSLEISKDSSFPRLSFSFSKKQASQNDPCLSTKLLPGDKQEDLSSAT